MIYAIIVIIYLWHCYDTPNDLVIQMGIFLLTIAAMMLIMLHNTEHQRKLTYSQIKNLKESTNLHIKELQKLTNEQIKAMSDSTEKQIKAIKESTEKQNEVFIEQFQGFSSQLEQLATILTMKADEEAEERKKQKELEEERFKKEEERLNILKSEQEKSAQEISDKLERIKPKIFVKIKQKSYFAFWQHYWLTLINFGGNGKDLRITSHIFNSGTNLGARFADRYEKINREQQQAFDCGNIDNFRAFDVVRVVVSIRDNEERKYVGQTTFNKTETEWVEIPLSKTSG